MSSSQKTLMHEYSEPCMRRCIVSPGPSLPKGKAWAPTVAKLLVNAWFAGLRTT
eukprot:CAMPEP_0119359370 /NCGR_PEP_ID=MMETSP1334-20130426/7277_1 /TAXON_ID=127549 /ORGANISM="Calcidiscus leptoporus, Strain RCC1130" /LENGTH=53 /DNA_ID=CAMNT_0007374033 /DNA_START=985 /DNA_END=1142 /DNA_ORIENTATION=+